VKIGLGTRTGTFAAFCPQKNSNQLEFFERERFFHTIQGNEEQLSLVGATTSDIQWSTMFSCTVY
jgi:hypothetical protein